MATSKVSRIGESYKNGVQKFSAAHAKVPAIGKLPARAALIIYFLAFLNVVIWIAVGILLHYHSGLAGTAVLAYTLGLRHALDADHISAIDLMTRRLIASGQRPVTVGTFFSLGHSTIVVITSIVTAATASAISKDFNSFSSVGGIIGTSVSAAFLLILGIANAYILYVLVRQMRKILASRSAEQAPFKIEGGGCLFRTFKKLFKLIDR